MAKRRGSYFIAAGLLLANMFFLSALPVDVSADATYVDILRPRLSVPVIQEIDGYLVMEVDSDATTLSNWYVNIETEYDSYPLVLNDATQGPATWRLNVTIPSTARPDLYDLVVEVDGKADNEPHAVSLVTEFKDEFSFIHMTDIHIKDAPSANEDNLRRAIKETNLIRPELVIITGDIGDNPEGVGQNEVAEYQRVRDILMMFEVPVYVVNGNHDYDSDLFEPSPIYVYRDIINPYPDFSFDYGDYHFVGMDSGEKTAYYGLPGCMMGTGLTGSQISWLDADLSAHSDSEQTFIFMHHTAFDPDKVYEMGFNWNSSISQNQQELLEISNQYGISMVLTGHTHLDEVWDGNGNKQTGGTLGNPPSPLFVQTRAIGKGSIGDVGYRLIRVNGSDLDSYTYDLDGNGFRDADKSIPSHSLDLSFSPSNDGSSRKVTATITNDLNEDFQNAFLEFVMPKPGADFETIIINGSVEQTIETPDSQIYYVRANLPMTTTRDVVLIQDLLPIASFIHSPSFPTTSDMVVFNDSSTDPDGSVVAWSWDFGDGNTSTDRNATHAYGEPGTYTVTLMVTDNDGKTRTKSMDLEIDPASVEPKKPERKNLPPTAGISYSPGHPVPGSTVQFTDLSADPDNSIVEWSWDFGDGRAATTGNPVHIYSNPGMYTVKLTVTDEDGASDTAIITINVNEETTASAIPLDILNIPILILIAIPILLIILIYGWKRKRRSVQDDD
jgi:PKD repeat protein/predicted phosphodiesterase